MSRLGPHLSPHLQPRSLSLTRAGVPSWSPRALFAAGEQGAWYDPSDLSTLFQDSAGTTPVTAVGQPVALVKDKSGNGHDWMVTGTTLARDSRGALCLQQHGFATNTPPVVDLSASSKAVFFAGYRLDRDDLQTCIVELGNSSSQAGTFALFHNIAQTGGLLADSALFVENGGARLRSATNAGSISHVVGIIDLRGAGSANRMQYKVNGADVSETYDGSDSGTVNFGSAYSLYIGQRADASMKLQGAIYGIVIVGGGLSAADIAKGDNFVASRMHFSIAIPPVFATGSTVDVLVVTGQSNAEGRGDASTSPSVSQYAGGYWTGTKYMELVDPVGGARTGSAWPAFANAYYAATGRGVLVVEQAEGGTNLIAGISVTDDWSPTGTLRGKAVAAANAAASFVDSDADVSLGKVMFAWAQGETDADSYNGTTVTDATYQSALESLFSYFQANVTAGIDSILVSQLGAPNDGVNAANWALIRAAQAAAVANTTGSYVAANIAKDFVAQGKMVDRMHYNQAGLNELGAAMGGYAATLVA